MTEENTTALSAEESAYFDSRGETDVPAVVEPEKVAEPVVTDPAAVDPEIDPAAPLRDEKGKFVPHGALHAEREEHKKTREELRKVAERQAILDDRWNTMLQAAKAQEQPPVDDDPRPDPNVDIFAHNAWMERQLLKEQQTRTEREKTEKQTKQEQEQETLIWNHWDQSVNQFVAETPDFADAAKYLSDFRVKQLKALGLSDANINKTIDTELKQQIIACAQSQMSPAQVVYEYAKASGYTGPKPADPVPAVPNGELPDKLKNIQNAQERSRTLSASPGGGAPNPDSTDALLAMSETEFAKWLEKGNFRRVMGG